jgi:hypothetical protein
MMWSEINRDDGRNSKMEAMQTQQVDQSWLSKSDT